MRTNLFIKVVVQHEEKENPERLGAELCRQLSKNFIVRSAELSSYSSVDSGLSDEGSES
jgi:hypothetical protein